MSRTNTDVLRSLARYFSFALPDDFDIRFSTDDPDWDRPSALIQYAGPSLPSKGPKVFESTRPFVVYAYPNTDDDAEQAALNATETEDAIIHAIMVGVEKGRPKRIPLYDYDGIDLYENDGVTPMGLPEDAEPEGFIWVQDANTNPTSDPNNVRLWTVTTNLRLNWTRLGEPKDELRGNIVAEPVALTPEPS